MIVIKNNIHSHFTKVDRRVYDIPKEVLSDGGKVLYMHLLGVQHGRNFTDGYFAKKCYMSLRALANKKKELKDLDLIAVKQISPRVYLCFVGNTFCKASKVKSEWERGNNIDKQHRELS